MIRPPIAITPVHVAVLHVAADGLLTVGDGERAYPPADSTVAELLDADLLELEVSRSPLLLDRWRPTPAGELVAAVAAWRASFHGRPAQLADRELAELVDRLWPDARGDAPALEGSEAA